MDFLRALSDALLTWNLNISFWGEFYCLACCSGNEPYKPSVVVSFKGTPGLFFPPFPTEQVFGRPVPWHGAARGLPGDHDPRRSDALARRGERMPPEGEGVASCLEPRELWGLCFFNPLKEGEVSTVNEEHQGMIVSGGTSG